VRSTRATSTGLGIQSITRCSSTVSDALIRRQPGPVNDPADNSAGTQPRTVYRDTVPSLPTDASPPDATCR
jgi:hypothetical protein